MKPEQTKVRKRGAEDKHPVRNYRMWMGNDYKFHFIDAEMRRKAGDDYVFMGNEPGMDLYMIRTVISAG